MLSYANQCLALVSGTDKMSGVNIFVNRHLRQQEAANISSKM